MTDQETVVSMGEINVRKSVGRYRCVGLGSCVVLCLMDPSAQVGGVAHVMLPNSFECGNAGRPARFADTAVDAMFAQMRALGATPEKTKAALVGGASLFKFSGPTSTLDIGRRNVESLVALLDDRNINIVSTNTGGTQARGLSFTLETGEVVVHTPCNASEVVCNLRTG